MEPSTSDIKNAANNAGQYAVDKTKKAANIVSDKASQVADQLEDQQGNLENIYGMARDRAEDALDASVDFVKKYPFYTVAGAAALGLVAGLLLRRSRR